MRRLTACRPARLRIPPDHMPHVTRVAIVQALPPSPPPAEPTARDRLRASLQTAIEMH